MTSKSEREEKAFWRDMGALRMALLVDLDRTQHRARIKGSQLSRRNYVRSAFAAIEGLTWTLKLAAVRVEQRGRVAFTPGELALLTEMSYELDEKGNVSQRPARLSLKSNIRFAMSAFAKANGVTFDLRVGGDKWEAFTQAIKIRDRLVHPKSIRDIRVSDEEFTVMEKAIEWWTTEITNLFSVALNEQVPAPE